MAEDDKPADPQRIVGALIEPPIQVGRMAFGDRGIAFITFNHPLYGDIPCLLTDEGAERIAAALYKVIQGDRPKQ